MPPWLLHKRVSRFQIQEGSGAVALTAATGLTPNLSTEIPKVSNHTFFKAEDTQCFAKILKEKDKTELSVDKMKECKIMRLLQITNSTSPVCKTALRQIIDKAHEFSAGPLFERILPLLMVWTLEDQEHHLLVKVINCIVQT